MNRKFISVMALLLCGILALSGCAGTNSGKANSDEPVVATANGENIYLSDFNFMYYENAAQFQQYGAYFGITDWENMTLKDFYAALGMGAAGDEVDDRTCGQYVRESALDMMASLVVTEKKAAEYGIKADKDITNQANTQKNSVIENSFGGQENYQDYLSTYFTTDDAITRYLTRSLISSSLFEKLSEDGGECAVSEEEALAEFSNKYLKVKHVLIKFDEETTEEAALAEANEVIAALNAGADMDQLIEAHGDDPGMESQDYYVFTEGTMVDEFYQASKALEIGAWSQEPVASSYGYHVIQRYELDPKTDAEYQEVKSTLAQDKFSALIESWMDEAKIKINDDVIDEKLAAQAEEADRRDAEAAAQAGNDAAQAGGDADALTIDLGDSGDEELPENIDAAGEIADAEDSAAATENVPDNVDAAAEAE